MTKYVVINSVTVELHQQTNSYRYKSIKTPQYLQ